MPGQEFEVVYTGKIVAGTDKKKLVTQLVELFGVPRPEIAKLFSSKGAVVARFGTRDEAADLVSKCRNAGVLCTVRQEEKAAEAPQMAAPRPGGYKTVKLTLGKSNMVMTPQKINRLGSYEHGLITNRQDVNQVAFTDITHLAVYGEEGKTFIVFFCTHFKRPLIAGVMSIAYGDFPITPEARAEDSLRKIAELILAGNPSIVIDTDTEAFLKGERPAEHKGGAIALATALSEASPREAAAVQPAVEPAVSPEVKQQSLHREVEAEVRQLTECPKCGAPVEKGMKECSRCGLIFQKGIRRAKAREAHEAERREYEKKKQAAAGRYAAEAKQVKLHAPPLESSRMEVDENVAASWIKRMGYIATALLFTGFLLPTLRTSVSFGKTVFIWAWHYFSLSDLEFVERAAMTTLGDTPHLALWALVPLVVAVAGFLSNIFVPESKRPAVLAIIGMVGLVLMTVVFNRSNQILGSLFVPTARTAGVICLTLLLGLSMLIGGNHLRKEFPAESSLRVLQGVGGLAVAVITVMMIVMGGGSWASWPLYITYLMLIALAAGAIWSALTSSPPERVQGGTSVLWRAMVAWSVFAAIIAQHYYASDFIKIMVTSPGGISNVITAQLKTAAIFIGLSMLMASGFTAALEREMIRKTHAGKKQG